MQNLIAHGERLLQSREFISTLSSTIRLIRGEEAEETMPPDLVEEARQVLHEEVRSDWTEADVENLVYSVLEEGPGDEDE